MPSDFYRRISVKVPNRSGFDKSFKHLFSAKPGTLIPCFWDYVNTDHRVHLKSVISAQLPPLASDTFMQAKVKFEAFFVPLRQLYGGFQYWLTGDKIYDDNAGDYVAVGLPRIVLGQTVQDPSLPGTGPGTLADYLGFKQIHATGSTSEVQLGAWPFLCYHWIWNWMYRNTRVQSKIFSPVFNGNPSSITLCNFPFVCFNQIDPSRILDSSSFYFPDGLSLMDLRQRNFGSDYFTTATPHPTADNVIPTVSTSSDGFTIASLRAANSLQMYLERSNMAGFDYVEFLRAHFGKAPSQGLAQQPLFLGQMSVDVYSKGVESTANVEGNTQNPFAGTTGARYGSSFAVGNNTLIEDFTAEEPGIIMVMCSLVPKVVYSSGSDRLLHSLYDENSQTDLPFPLLQNLGPQPVFKYELGDNAAAGGVFGYVDRYAEWMTKVDRVSGLLRDGQSLEAFALQRTFEGDPTLSSSFLEIPTDYFDQVSAVAESISDYGYWCDCFFDYKVSMPLHEYSIPSLQDPAYEHGHSVSVSRTAQKVD